MLTDLPALAALAAEPSQESGTAEAAAGPTAQVGVPAAAAEGEILVENGGCELHTPELGVSRCDGAQNFMRHALLYIWSCMSKHRG